MILRRGVKTPRIFYGFTRFWCAWFLPLKIWLCIIFDKSLVWTVRWFRLLLDLLSYKLKMRKIPSTTHFHFSPQPALVCGNEEQILRGRFSFLLLNGDDADDNDDYDEKLILWAKVFFLTPNCTLEMFNHHLCRQIHQYMSFDQICFGLCIQNILFF